MRRITVVLMALGALLVGGSNASIAARTTGYGLWGPITGETTNYATTMQLPATGFPAADVTSDSRSDISVATGASNWFGANTPPGSVYGSSRDQPYLLLRPRVDNAASPSTTVYTFDRPTPQGWTFVLGDIDSDDVRVAATRADGTPATTAELGFRSVFNLCATTPRPSSVCANNGRPKDIPTWDPLTATLRGNDGAIDSDGATGWFEPTTSLRTLTFTFTRRAGLPIFQTWFAVARQAVSGGVTVTSGACDLAGAVVSLIDAQGVVVATRPASAGTYAFDDVAASTGYRVALTGIPGSCAASLSSIPIDLTAGNVVADFSVAQVIPAGSVAGTVTLDGDPLAGAVVSIRPPGGSPTRITTDAQGAFGLAGLAPGSYEIAVARPGGTRGTAARDVTITSAGDQLTGQDFAFTTNLAAQEPVPDDEGFGDSTPAALLPEVGGPAGGLPALGLGFLLVFVGATTTLVALRRRS